MDALLSLVSRVLSALVSSRLSHWFPRHFREDHMKKPSVFPLLLFVLLAIAAIARQEPAPAPKPGPEHEKLAYFVGKWTSEGDIKASSFVSASESSITE